MRLSGGCHHLPLNFFLLGFPTPAATLKRKDTITIRPSSSAADGGRGDGRSRSLPRRFAQSKTARKIFPFLASFRSLPPRDSAITRHDLPSLSVATTVESLGEEVLVEDSQPQQCTATTSVVNLGTALSDEIAADDGGADVPSTSTPGPSTSTQGVSVAKVARIPEASEIAVIASVPRVSVESVQIIASSEGTDQTDSPGSEQRRYELKCGDEFFVVDVDQRRGRPFTLYKKQESITKPPPGFKASSSTMGQGSGSKSPAAKPDDLEVQALQQSKTEAALKTLSKLRYILHQLNSGQLPLDDLKKNIEYAALVLETAYMDETRRICDEDDDLAEVTPDTVPDEVREWLAATFTRQAAAKKREKPKFKSVANAIRTGIFFDKIFRKTQTVLAPIPPEYAVFLKNINSWAFSSFELNEVTDGHALKYIGFEIFNRYGFLERFKVNYQILDNYLLALEQGYNKHNNPYHNTVHAADVAQTSHFMLSQTGLASSLSDLEMLAVLFGALIHDYEHTGHTNNFHIQSGSHFALLYNDRSVLENHHVSSCFRLLKDDDKNIFERLNRDEFRELRNMVIEIVLATDMSTHFVQIKTMKNMLTLPEGIDKMKALCLIVHACDISHASKPWDLHYRWTEGVLEEFFRQGDLEASMGLPYSPLCDRHTVHVAESQIGFIDFIVEPTMVVCGEMLTKMVEPLVSLPSSDSLFPPGSNNDGRDGSTSATSLSPIPDLKSPTGSNSVRKIPINYFGKLEIPNPWIKHMPENKAHWRERAIKEEQERNAKANGTSEA